MKPFECSCGARVFFENTDCLSCGSRLGFAPELRAMLVVQAEKGEGYALCANAELGVCNWLVNSAQPQELCIACRLNALIPDLSLPENLERWRHIEAAKRRLIYTLTGLGLPLVPRSEDPQRGLLFDFKASTPAEQVMTGHANGVITLNIAEADPVLSVQARCSLNERYRTLLGHLRHEIGHYYWDVLLRDDPQALSAFRQVFGDERLDYAEALRTHYATPSPPLSGDFVSAYAAAHPLEDWAESFAHYLHVVDLLETAEAFGLGPGEPYRGDGSSFDAMLARFAEVSVLLNALNRSVGHEDAYPFAPGAGARKKLAFVAETVARSTCASS